LRSGPVDILELLDQLDEELAAGRKMPIGAGVVVDRKRFSDLINELRLAIPANVRQARGIIERGEQTLEEARAEAARIVAAAEQDAAQRVANSEILRRAQEEAHRIEFTAQETAARVSRLAEEQAQRLVAEAESVARQQREDADAYAVALLTQLQKTLGSFLGNVRESLRAFPEREGG
jgi:hypothetical protein